MPDANVGFAIPGRVFYDADCSLCRGLLVRFGQLTITLGLASLINPFTGAFWEGAHQ